MGLQQNPSAPRRHRVTTWKNPTDKVVSFSIFRNQGPPGHTHDLYVLKPGEDVTISSEEDQTIRETNQAGQVIGGHAPMLLKIGEREEEVNVHPALKAGFAGGGGRDDATQAMIDQLKAENAALKAEAEKKDAALLGVLDRISALEQAAKADAAPAPKAVAKQAPRDAAKPAAKVDDEARPA